MAKYTVQDPNTGRTVDLEGDSPPSEQELNDIFSALPEIDSSSKTESGFMDTIKNKSIDYATDLLQKGPIRTITDQLPVIGMFAGEAIGSAMGGPSGGIIGGAIGSGLGQIGSRMGEIATGEQVKSGLNEAISPMVQTALGAVANVKGLTGVGKAVPELSPNYNPISQAGRFLKSAGKTVAGVKEDILGEGYKRGLKTYLAPSIDKAQDIFAKALGPEGQAALKQNVDDVFDPLLGRSREIAKEIGNKIDKGLPVTVIEALKARKATDRIISSTPITDKELRGALYDWRSKFDDVISSQSGPLKEASTKYRQAIVKDKLLSPTRLTKSGEPSAFLPLVLGAGGRSLEGIANTLVGTSPAVWGFGATTLGTMAKVPRTLRQALITQFVNQQSKGEVSR